MGDFSEEVIVSSANHTVENYKKIIKILPSGPVLFLSKVLDTLLFTTKWRDYLPFGLGTPPLGIFSHKIGNVSLYFPKLREKGENEEWMDFISSGSTVLGDLTRQSSLMIIAVLVLALCLVKLMLLPVFETLAVFLATRAHGKEWVQKNQVRITKFSEYVFRLLYHFAVSTYAIIYFQNKSWWNNTIYLWKDYPNQSIEPGMIWFYLIQAAYNVEALIYLIRLSFQLKIKNYRIQIGWSQTVRGDFREMAIHHFITNLLIFLSSYLRLNRVGSVIFILHDVSDVPVDLSKLANFMKWKICTVICFTLMVVVWFITRLGILPFVIFPSCLNEVQIMMDDGLDPLYFYAYRWPLYVLVCVMIALHAAWFTMFLKMGYVLVTRGEAHDLSEHKQGEKQD